MNTVEAFLAQMDSEADRSPTKRADFLKWLSVHEDPANLTLPELKFAWAEYEAVGWAQSVDYPESHFWYEGKWEPITRW